LKQTFDERDEQSRALFESAAVGLSARGLAHEVRTHLSEIRQRTAVIEKASKSNKAEVLPHLRAIRASCSAISSAAALIDPMLPRTRAIKETMSLKSFVRDYFEARGSVLETSGIKYSVTGGDVLIRANRPRLTQVLDNLVRNSMYWLRRAEITGEVGRAKLITVEVTHSGFVVADSGPGVDPHYEDSLFELFVTGKPEKDTGQGLGLFIITELLRIDGCELTLLQDRNLDGRRYRFAVNLLPIVVPA
jgi:signal transduction histidine kinase